MEQLFENWLGLRNYPFQNMTLGRTFKANVSYSETLPKKK